ncbi:MAG: glycosyl hydrolase [Alteromonadaceae bacterium]|uniref:glycoside hydrolase family 117 protein n=1 Tax=Paraglaciecola chathamensis TaxID=368405 RepID=UPI000C5696B1|nr:glycosyl hydrolase [Paraglaciecola agarilytica]MBN25521.1 glycosyl hydrolase [Alteromonadaceae bacterium]|tara:strand:+ start:29704 stop:30963 length:1260 start_codon:yes stop_codon:yes gene_type:complete
MKYLLLGASALILTACNSASISPSKRSDPSSLAAPSHAYSQADYDYLAISDPEKMSAASKRALARNYHKNEEWFGEFRHETLFGDFAFDEDVSRRDPSKVLKINGVFYTWYTRTTGETKGFGTGDPDAKVFPWDHAEIWYATSKDGYHWQEKGRAVGPGQAGQFDDRSVFTPEVLAHKGTYYLVYQAIKAPYLNRTKNTVAMAYSSSPEGPWRKLDAPILTASDTGEWAGTQDNHFLVKSQGDFDSHKVHDPTLLFYRNKFYLYYKGERMGERKTAGGREIRWGVAIADNPQGPYIKSDFNPITHSGHELCVWQYQDGIAIVSSHDGPEKQTIQFAPDGINFEIMAYLPTVPSAMGLVESLDKNAHPTAGLEWGLYHEYVIPAGKTWMSGGNQIKRFSFQSQYYKPSRNSDELTHNESN